METSKSELGRQIEAEIRLMLAAHVGEPNDEPLWALVRERVGEILFAYWQDGRLVGDSPDEAYFVRCDQSTMTQSDLDAGRLVVLVGFAPLRPAEFEILRIEQVL
jgi:uncharacterized protein